MRALCLLTYPSPLPYYPPHAALSLTPFPLAPNSPSPWIEMIDSAMTEWTMYIPGVAFCNVRGNVEFLEVELDGSLKLPAQIGGTPEPPRDQRNT